jgi:cardiolipin synthase
VPNAFIPDFDTAYQICNWVIRIAMLLVVPMRRTPEATRSWLLLIFFLPVVGFLLFLAIGRPSFPAWRRARFASLAPFLADVSAKFAASPITIDPHASAPALAQKLGGWPAVDGNAVAFLDDYDEVIARLIAEIDGARLNVRILAYIFADDATGRQVIDALGRAVRRGVVCHVLVDPIGSHRWIRNTVRLLRQGGVETRETLPLHWLRGRTRRDMRNHRKLFLIDGTVAYAGSQNIVAKDFRPGVINRELVLRMTGPVVAQMDALFVGDWFLETETLLSTRLDLPASTGTAIAQLLPSGADHDSQGFEILLVSQIHAARDRVMITTPYLIPDEGLIGAMRTAVLRGVAVDVIVSAVADQPLVSFAQRSFYDELLANGVRIHRYRDNLLHAKAVSIDGSLAIVGSSNVDIRSFQLNEEASVNLYDQSSIATLEALQRDYIMHSSALNLTEWRRRPLLAKVAESLARLVTPLL